ncbi:hypothetical protein PAMP_009346 [Pampus punctatissimus]
MVVSKKETIRIRRFVCRQLDAGPDLSTLTLGILKRRYLAHEGCESLSLEARNFMKQVVEEELMKMQENDQNGSELETKMPQTKRKREKESELVKNERDSEDESRAKKSRRQLSSSSESDDKEDHKTGSEESEEEEQIKIGSGDEEQKSNGKSKQEIMSEDLADEEKNESETNGSDSSCADSPKEKVKKKANTTKNEAITSSNTSQGKKTLQSDEEDGADSDSKSEKSDKNNVNDSEKQEKVLVEKNMNESDSDSSSLPSLESEHDGGTEKKQDTEKKKRVKKEDESSKSQKDDNKVVLRLKRYISLCGVRRNYKKLLKSCRSVRSMVAVLKKELEDLGVQGQPTIEKCKKVRMKREEAQELAELDVSNIIATQGRSKRRGASAWQTEQDPPSSAYHRSLNTSSDSDQENTHRGRRRATDWTNLQGIISDDADSD